MIEATSCLIQSYKDTDHNHAMARVDSAMSGCATQIRLISMGDCGSYWLCRRADDPLNDYILLLPSSRWEQDARDAGFELVQKLNQRPTPPKHHPLSQVDCRP